MRSDDPVVKILLSAIKYLFWLLGIISILSLPFGGPLLLLYYWFYVLLYIVPVGLLAGAIMGWRSLIKTSSQKKKQAPLQLNFSSKVALVFIFVTLTGFLALPYFTIGQDGYVWVRANWHLVEKNEVEQQFHRLHSDCDTQLILLVPEMYDQYELICDQHLLDYLENTNPEYVSIIYHVKYNFGKPHSHTLHKVDATSINGITSKWIGQWSGCGNIYEHSCDDVSVRNASSIIGGIQSRKIR